MKLRSTIIIPGAVLLGQAALAQKLPDVSLTFKGTLMLPVPVANPLFTDLTETIGMLDGVVQYPFNGGLGAGLGARMTWFGIDERALSPVITTGEVRRSTYYAKAQYERFTGERTFYELSARFGTSTYVFDCPTCPDDRYSVFHWGVGTGYYLHATDNLAFGLTLGYETDALRFTAAQLGLERFPGRTESEEGSNFQNIVIGLGFSTRFRKSPDSGPGW